MRPLRFQSVRGSQGTVPIDRAYLEAQVPSLAGTDRHMAHYLANGLPDGLDPTRFFSTDWYAWQNPDWSDNFKAPYLHFMELGRKQGRDPSPMVDVTRYLDMTAGAIAPEQVYPAILSGLRSVSLGVYEDDRDLLRCQNAFMDGIAVFAHRTALVRNPRKALVVCQAGRGALLDSWALDPAREWDLMLNYYDSAGMKRGLGEYVFFQRGTKFTAMKFLTDRFPQIFSAYEHVLFVDDDIGMSAGTLNALFAACRRHSLDLAQMSLTAGSACNWSELFARPGRSGPRDVSAVEIMMPVFSRRALGWIKPTLGQSVSGFGLDLVWGKIVSGKSGRIAVLDDIVAAHERPVDQSGGAYYRYLRRHGINAKAELWLLLKRYDAGREMIAA